jgi:hypothetical protein
VNSMRMRRLSERARLEGMLALRKALDGVRRGPGALFDTDDEAVRASLSERDTNPSAWWVRAEAELDGITLAEPEIERGTSDVMSERDAEFIKGLDRIAESIERVAAQLDSYHQERAEHLDAIEFLLREMVIGTIPASASRPIVLGGVIESDAHEEREISLVTDTDSLEVDAPVEVRSRFHDRWIGGFTISEAVNTPGRQRYRLTRRSDGIPLPILFDACDVRAAEDAFSRQHSPS